ncbi:hypothetical protein NFI96_030520 [Prochilodus magdalenae]|nr:hypothetical protein NFI96_030520 [Prochilodus magdalenae]
MEEKLQKSETEKSEVDAQNKKLQQDLEEAKKCTKLQKSYDELQAQFSKEVGQLNNSLAGQVLSIQTLSVEVEAIQKKLNKSEGNAGALKAELQKKKSALEKVTKDLKKSRADSAELMKLMESMRKLSRKQEQSISDYLAEIDRMEKETEALMTKLGARGDEKSQLTIQVIALKAQLANLEKLQEELKQEAEEKTKDLKKYIEERNKEIAYLKKSGCGGDQMKNRIAKLEAEVKAKQQELGKLKDSSDAEVNKLQKKITETAQKLDKSGDKLKQKDEQNVELIKRLAGLEEQLRQATSGRDTYKQTAQKQIEDLKKEVKDKEKEVSTLESSNADLKKQLRTHQENIADLKKSNTALKGELDRKQEALTKTQKEVKNKETTIASLKEQLQKKAEEAKEQGKCEGVVEENGRLREQLTEVHARMKKLQEASRENRELKEKLKAANDKVKELENTGSGDARIAVASPELDPDTAHPRLLLSHNGQTVRASEFSRYVPNNPGRYDSALAAVGKTGYITGRHFWEVQVQNRACFVVGMAKESAQRKGVIKYGPSKGYWGILKRKDGRYQVLTDKPIDLLVSDKLTTVGVLVDIGKGEISFYNAKLKTLLYTFSGNTFEERLYPYIETCTDQSKNEPPIVISKPQSILWLELK